MFTTNDDQRLKLYKMIQMTYVLFTVKKNAKDYNY